MERTVSYSAVVLDEKSQGLLKQKFGQLITGWEWIAHHMTICMGPIQDQGLRTKIGQMVLLNITDLGRSDMVIAVKAVGFYTTKAIPHITLFVNRAEGGKPFMSNKITEWTPIESPFTLTGVVTEVFNTAPLNESITDVNTLPFLGDVKAAGGKIYQVGGAVRDSFLDKDSKDLDILIQGIPAETLNTILHKYGRVDMVGASFGVIKFKAHGTTEEIDIAIPRTERKIGDGYKGFDVTADHTLPVEKDLERRDFTINSIAKDMEGNLIDPFGGQADLKNKVIRITNPVAFQEDPLRMLRAVQFAARFIFKIEPVTFKLIKDNAATIREISGERILIELEKIVAKGNPAVGAKLLVETGLFQEIFQATPNMDYNMVIESKTMAEFIYTMTYRSIRRPSDFFKKSLKGDLETSILLKAFEKGNDENDVETLQETEVDKRKVVFNIYKISREALKSFIVRDLFDLDDTIRTMRKDNIPFGIHQLAINGDDLMTIGLVGKQVGDMHKMLIIAIFNNQIKNRHDELMAFAKQPLNESINKIKSRF